MPITPPDNGATRRESLSQNKPEPQSVSHSQTIQANGERSERPSPPPRNRPDPGLYPDYGNFPLPERVDEVDLNATRVSSSAIVGGGRRPPAGGNSRRSRNGWGCFVQGLVIVLFGLVALLIMGAIGAVLAYYSIASTLPSVDDLRQRSAQFETTRILDRNGNSLYEILDPNAGRRTYVKLDQISPDLVAATIATEDKEFYTHPGFDPLAIIRAIWQNYTSGGNSSSGASTITQQLARALLLSPEERVQRTYQRKIREIILAAEITRRYGKDEILELYLNEI